MVLTVSQEDFIASFKAILCYISYDKSYLTKYFASSVIFCQWSSSIIYSPFKVLIRTSSGNSASNGKYPNLSKKKKKIKKQKNKIN